MARVTTMTPKPRNLRGCRHLLTAHVGPNKNRICPLRCATWAVKLCPSVSRSTVAPLVVSWLDYGNDTLSGIPSYLRQRL